MILSKAINRLNAIPTKLPMAFFTEVEQRNFHLYQNRKDSQIVKTILRKKNKAGGIILPDFSPTAQDSKQYGSSTKTGQDRKSRNKAAHSWQSMSIWRSWQSMTLMTIYVNLWHSWLCQFITLMTSYVSLTLMTIYVNLTLMTIYDTHDNLCQSDTHDKLCQPMTLMTSYDTHDNLSQSMTLMTSSVNLWHSWQSITLMTIYVNLWHSWQSMTLMTIYDTHDNLYQSLTLMVNLWQRRPSLSKSIQQRKDNLFNKWCWGN